MVVLQIIEPNLKGKHNLENLGSQALMVCLFYFPLQFFYLNMSIKTKRINSKCIFTFLALLIMVLSTLHELDPISK
jgi:hypothetical protein